MLLFVGQTIAGMLWLLIGSFGMMAWTYRKPWRIGWISCLLPPGAAALCYLVQLTLFQASAPPLALVAVAAGTGVLVGVWRARTHVVRQSEDGGIIAERTFGYLLVWVLAYGCTQFFSMLAITILLVRAGLVTGAFTTAMLAVVSIVIFRKGRHLGAAAMAGVMVLCGAMLQPAPAQAQSSVCAGLHDETTSALKTLTSVVYTTLNVTAGQGARYSDDQCHWSILVRGRNVSGVLSFDMGTAGSTDQAQRWLRDAGGQSIPRMGDDGGRYSFANQPSGSRYEMYSRLGARVLATRVDVSMSAERFDKARSEGLIGWLNETVFGAMRSIHDRAYLKLSETIHARVFAAVTSALIAAGVAVHVAQAVAAAIANAVQAGVQVTAEDVQNAIAEALLARSPLGGESARGGDPPRRDRGGSTDPPGSRQRSASSDPSSGETRHRAPPNTPGAERVRPPTPIYDENGEPFETNDKGEYWGPDENGDWRWLNRQEAREASEALRQERETRAREQEEHHRQAARDREEWWKEREEEAQQARREAEARRAATEAEAQRRDHLLDGMLEIAGNLPPGEDAAHLISRLAEAHESGELWQAEAVWEELRGDRQSEVDRWQRESQAERDDAYWYGVGETGATFVRDVAKGTAAAAAGAASAPLGLVGATGAVAIGAVEEGYKFDPDKDRVTGDFDAFMRGAAKGGKSAFQARLGGMDKTGWAARAGRVAVNTGLDAGETYFDVRASTYEREMSKHGDPVRAMAAAEDAAEKAGWQAGKISLASGTFNEAIDTRAATRQVELEGFAKGRDQVVTEAAKTANGMLANTARNVSIKGEDLPTALGNAAWAEGTGRAGQGMAVGSGMVRQNPFSGFFEQSSEAASATDTTGSPGQAGANDPSESSDTSGGSATKTPSQTAGDSAPSPRPAPFNDARDGIPMSDIFGD
ncbi:hypothetical protein ACFFU4_00160 [Roseovarius ramblicola]|uniref:Uncharacterized protein n=1 Tax=Roseovarius ramblicola TaxID=2022336 RepID=A0ABV5HUR3_9RHOB